MCIARSGGGQGQASTVSSMQKKYAEPAPMISLCASVQALVESGRDMDRDHFMTAEEEPEDAALLNGSVRKRPRVHFLLPAGLD